MKKIVILLLIALWVFLVLYTHANAATVRQYKTYVSVSSKLTEGTSIGQYILTYSDFYAKGWAVYDPQYGIYYPLKNKYGIYLLTTALLNTQ